MRKTLVVFLTLLFALACSSLASANTISLDVTVDTSSVSGSNGNLDFTFGAGLSSQAATATISNFTGGVVGLGTLSGDSNGSLVPGPLTINNTSGMYNDFFVVYTYGAKLSFTLAFSGPAVSSPDGISDASTFAFSMLDSTGANSIVPVGDPYGFLFTTDLNNTGAADNTIFGQGVTIKPSGGPPPPVPEPSMLPVLPLALAGLAAFRRKFGR